jgi:hypothetical protein
MFIRRRWTGISIAAFPIICCCPAIAGVPSAFALASIATAIASLTSNGAAAIAAAILAIHAIGDAG